MATTKQQALAAVTEQDTADMVAMREKIEEALKRHDGHSPVSVTPQGSRKARERVAEEYRAIGWTVAFGDDRDGGWMSLS